MAEQELTIRKKSKGRKLMEAIGRYSKSMRDPAADVTITSENAVTQ